MNISTHRFNHGLVFILGLILIIAGIVTSTEGAWIAGLLDCWIDRRGSELTAVAEVKPAMNIH